MYVLCRVVLCLLCVVSVVCMCVAISVSVNVRGLSARDFIPREERARLDKFDVFDKQVRDVVVSLCLRRSQCQSKISAQPPPIVPPRSIRNREDIAAAIPAAPMGFLSECSSRSL